MKRNPPTTLTKLREIIRDAGDALERGDPEGALRTLRSAIVTTEYHSWRREPRRWWEGTKRFTVKHCIKCGAEQWQNRPYTFIAPLPKNFYRPFGSTVAFRFTAVPRCEGLPPQYDAPVGA